MLTCLSDRRRNYYGALASTDRLLKPLFVDVAHDW